MAKQKQFNPRIAIRSLVQEIFQEEIGVIDQRIDARLASYFAGDADDTEVSAPVRRGRPPASVAIAAIREAGDTATVTANDPTAPKRRGGPRGPRGTPLTTEQKKEKAKLAQQERRAREKAEKAAASAVATGTVSEATSSTEPASDALPATPVRAPRAASTNGSSTATIANVATIDV